jgi:NADP-dependent 3-hydroxy acid dehydrogenase YdfG
MSERGRRIGLVTGAASGIGCACRSQSRGGSHVTVAEIDKAGGAETTGEGAR